MKSKAMEFKILPLILLMVALSFPLQAALLFGHTPSEVSAILQKLTLLNWSVIALSLLSAAALFRASKSTAILVPLTIAAVVCNNLVVGLYNTHFDLLTTSFASVGFALLFTPLAREPVRKALANPQYRWWRSSKRQRKHIDAILNPIKGATLCASTFDLSETGAFIAVPDAEDLSMLSEGQLLRLNLSLNSVRHIRCDAVIVRASLPNGSYPAGYGIRFVDLDSKQKRRLRQFLEA